MPERAPDVLIADMLEAVERIQAYTTGIDYEAFLNDQKTADAVLRNLQVLGEAANRVPDETRTAAPDVEWTRIVRSRHVIVHDYFGTDYEIVWRIVQVHLPPLQEALRSLQQRLSNP